MLTFLATDLATCYIFSCRLESEGDHSRARRTGLVGLCPLYSHSLTSRMTQAAESLPPSSVSNSYRCCWTKVYLFTPDSFCWKYESRISYTDLFRNALRWVENTVQAVTHGWGKGSHKLAFGSLGCWCFCSHSFNIRFKLQRCSYKSSPFHNIHRCFLTFSVRLVDPLRKWLKKKKKSRITTNSYRRGTIATDKRK